jgi:hypothetical protein
MEIRHTVRGAATLLALASIACATTAHATSSLRSLAATQAQQPADQVKVPLTDPSKPEKYRPGFLSLAGQHAPLADAPRYFDAMVGFTQPFFITPCDGRKLR